MRQRPRFCFIGFGEAGQTIAGGLRGVGVEAIAAWDILFPQPGGALREAAGRIGVRLASSLAEAVAGADLVVSAVTAASSLDVAREAASHLSRAQFFLDINSVSPGRKKEAAAMLGDVARFADVAVMAPVKPAAHRTPLLIAGPHTHELLPILASLDMRAQDAGPEIGAAAGVKMVRSVMIKGMEALTLECLLAARQAGIEDQVIASLTESFPTLDWRRIGDYNLERMASHGLRRAAEMRQVAETLRELGVDPVMTAGTIERQQRMGDLRLPKERLAALGDGQRGEILRAVAEAGDLPVERARPAPARAAGS